ncbi:MAG: peptide ABC transporter substrate-binding protein [Woeseiaceae bacterium]|nr:peptide ABC transporter substrate-binding protein [Woeseiaceae bacterium]
MSFFRRPLVLFSLLVVVALAFFFFPREGDRPDPFDGLVVLDRALSSEPESLDPQLARTTQAADVLRDLGEGLAGYSPTGELVPAGAISWTSAEDALSYRFELRREARWSNGDPVTASDYVLGLQRLVDPATAAFYAGQLGSVLNAEPILRGEMAPQSLGVEAIDDYTLEIRLERPTPYLVALLTHPSTFPVNASGLNERGEMNVNAGELISNGAYVLEERTTNTLVQLRRNEQYWNNQNTAIDVVRHHVITEEMAELNRFRAGELHITSNVPPESFAQVKEEYGDQLHVYPYLGVYYYGFNLTKPPFKDNLPLRQALSMALDRETLVEKIIGRGEVPAYSFVPPGIDNYEPPQFSYANLTQAERNSIARSLYAQAGYGDDNPLRFELRYNTSDTHQRIALAAQSMWKDVLGAEVTLVNEEVRVMLQNIRDAEITQLFKSSWIGDFNDAQNFLGVVEPGAPSNMPGYENEEYLELLRNAASNMDLERRRLFLEEAERVMLADHPVIPVYFFVSKHLVSNDVVGWGDNLLDYHYSQHLSLKPGEQARP